MSTLSKLGLPAPQPLNQANVNSLVATILALPLDQKQLVAAEIRLGFTAFVTANFILTPQWQTILSNMPAALNNEYSFTVALAVQESWNLNFTIPDTIPQGVAFCKRVTQTVEADYSYPPSSFEFTKGVNIAF